MSSNDLVQSHPGIHEAEQAPAPANSPRARDDYETPAARLAELILGPTGPFRPVIEQYMTTVAPKRYRAAGLSGVRASLGKFFRFVVQNQSIGELDQVRPSIVTQFVLAERERGFITFTYLGHLATFFVWAISEGLYDRGNPVINRLHRRLMKFGPEHI